MKIAVFCMDYYQQFEQTCCLHLQGRRPAFKMEAAGSSDMLATVYQTAWCHILEDSNFTVNAVGTSNLTFTISV
jgi:hypothetical protein